jgi:UDP-N-acetylmuramoyl-L-alanyl-D-glutamate--2,6-diaminopimelate ligase
MKISDIIYKDEYLYSDVDDNTEFDNLTTDINNVSKSDILIIPNHLKLDKLDLPTRPIAVICDVGVQLPKEFPTIRVKAPRIATARAFYRYEKVCLDKIKLIGVTGTNGKGGTAEFIKTVLEASGYKVGLFGTGKIEIDGRIISDRFYSMTTPDPPLLYKSLSQMQEEGCDVVIMEVSSHALALDKLEPLIFDYGVFTNLSHEHLDFHISMDEYFKAKAKLFSMCKCGVINIDDEYGRRVYNICKSKRISVGILWKGDVWASNIEKQGLKGISYIYHGNNFSFKMLLQTVGIYNAYNSMLATALCIDMGCRPCEVKQILGQITSLPGRFEIINDRISVIIDYAHTDIAFKSIMKELSAIKGANKLTVIFGCGGNRDKEKRPRMAKIAERYADRVIVTSDNPRNENIKEIISDIIRGFQGENYTVIENRKDAIRAAILGANNGEIIAVIGKGCEKYYIDQYGYHEYNESDIIKSALTERGALL